MSLTLDSLIFSILFDDVKSVQSANKIEGIVNNLKTKIMVVLTEIASIDFLKNAVESSVKLATKLDNLSYVTNISKENLNAWGEAVKRNGGTVEGFYNSVSSISDKIRELQTNYGSAGQLVFARLHINLQKSNGQMKDAVDILEEIGDKFKTMPKVWQLNLGQQLGLDSSTIRLISQGNVETQKLVDHMKKLAGLNKLNTENNIKLRNSFYDLSLIWESMKIAIANFLIPYIQRFSELLLKSLNFLQEHSKVVKTVLLGLAVILSGAVLTSILTISRVILFQLVPALIRMTALLVTNPWFLLGTAIALLILQIQDFIVYLNGGKSAFQGFYEAISDENVEKQLDKIGKKIKDTFGPIIHFMDKITKTVRDFFGVKQSDDPLLKKIAEDKYENDAEYEPESESIKKLITKKSIELKVDPNIANTIANIESGFDPNAKNAKTSASGVFQLTDATALSSGINDLSKKNSLHENVKAGVKNIKNITDGLSKFFGRAPTGVETYIGEMLGLSGSEKVFSAGRNTMLSTLLSSSALNANPQYRNMTSGQLITNANKTYQQKSVTIGEVKINAPNSNARQISQHVGNEIKKHFTDLVTNSDNGRLS